MEGPFAEKDWKYLRRLSDDLLQAVCERINERAAAIASSEIGTPHERYLALFRHIKKSDAMVAECFNDWRRSRLTMIVFSLRKHGLLTDEHLTGLSEQAQNFIHAMEEMGAR